MGKVFDFSSPKESVIRMNASSVFATPARLWWTSVSKQFRTRSLTLGMGRSTFLNEAVSSKNIKFNY